MHFTHQHQAQHSHVQQSQMPANQTPSAPTSQIVTSFPQALFDFSSQNPNLSALTGMNGLQGMTTHSDGSVAFDTASLFLPAYNQNPFGQIMWNGQLEATTGGGMTDLWDDFDQIFDIRTPTMSQGTGTTPAVGLGAAAAGASGVVQGRPLFYGERPMRQGVSLAEICASTTAQSVQVELMPDARVVESWLVGLPSTSREYARARIMALNDNKGEVRSAVPLAKLNTRRHEGSALCCRYGVHLSIRF